MTHTLSIIHLTWDLRGKLNHRITGGYSDLYQDKVLILAPSLPMIISHQLGTYKPSQGLILCSTLFDFYIKGKHIQAPINSVLKQARIEFVRTDKGKVTLLFFPEGRLFANSDSLEEGSSQLLSNYLTYVSNDLPEQTWLIIKAFIGSTVDGYLDILNGEIDQRRVGPRKNKWNINISKQMAIQTSHIAEIYGPDLPEVSNIPKIAENMEGMFLEIQNKHKILCTKMGMMQD